MHGPAGAVLQGVYAKYFAMPLVELGAAILIARVFDGLTDPLIGYLSDRTQVRFGTRKPWLFGGMLISTIAVWQLYQPPEDISIGWFTTWFLLTYLGWTMIEIPYRSWSVSLSNDYSERTRVVTWIAMGTTIGGLLFFALPFILQALGVVETTEITPSTLAGAAVVVAVGLPITVLLALWRVPNPNTTETSEAKHDPLNDIVRSVFGNGPFLYLTGLFLFMGVGAGLGGGLIYLYIDVHLGLGEQFAGLMLIAAPLTLLATPLWGLACTKIEKHKVLAISAIVSAISVSAYGFVPTNGEGLWFLAALLMLNVVTQAAGIVAFPSIMGDVADYGRLKFGRDRTGLYFALFTMLQKSVGGIGISLGLFIAASFGFDATASTQSKDGVFGMILAVSYLPALATLVTIPLLWRFPIGKAQQEATRKALEQKALEQNEGATAHG